jgi:transposase-like protein
MSKSTISTFQLFETFPDEASARVYLEGRIWPNGPVCPDCKSDRVTTRTRPGFYHCNACNFDFTVRTGTVFERSKVPLHKWVYSMYLLVTARKGISSMQLAKEIGVTQKTAWFILGRLREACGSPGGPDDKLKGIVEIDECFIGGKEANKHEHKKLKAGRGSVGKTPVLGMRERGKGGRTVAVTLDAQTLHAIQSEIHAHVEVGSTLYTDENPAYNDLNGLFFRAASVNHSAGEYVRGSVHTNGMESVWAVLKRGLHGVYHHASPKHLFRYVDEFTFRLNEGNVARHTFERLDSFVDGIKGKRLTYEQLTGKAGA